jgi:hypothetical protein
MTGSEKIHEEQSKHPSTFKKIMQMGILMYIILKGACNSFYTDWRTPY